MFGLVLQMATQTFLHFFWHDSSTPQPKTKPKAMSVLYLQLLPGKEFGEEKAVVTLWAKIKNQGSPALFITIRSINMQFLFNDIWLSIYVWILIYDITFCEIVSLGMRG